MQHFIAKLGHCIEGVISGFDRLVFRGTLRRLYQKKGMEWYLCQNNVQIKDYAQHVEQVSAALKTASLEPFHSLGRTVEYLRSCRTNKEELARKIAAELLGAGTYESMLEGAISYPEANRLMAARSNT